MLLIFLRRHSERTSLVLGVIGKMLPLDKFEEILTAFKEQMSADYDELINAAHLLGSRPNYFTMDDNGLFHAQASGSLEECIRALEHHLGKLKKIKAAKEGRQ